MKSLFDLRGVGYIRPRLFSLFKTKARGAMYVIMNPKACVKDKRLIEDVGTYLENRNWLR